MALDLLLTAVRRDVILGVRVVFDGPLAFNDGRALDLRGDRDYGNSLSRGNNAHSCGGQRDPPYLGKNLSG